METLIEQERKLMDLLTRRAHKSFAAARAAGVPADVFGESRTGTAFRCQ